jgi:hypothetical protein
MAELVFKNAKVLLEGYDISGNANRVALSLTADALDRTAFGSSGRRRVAGLKDFTVTVDGFWDASTGRKGTTKSQGGGPDPVAMTLMGVQQSTALTVAIAADGTAPGQPAYFGRIVESGYSFGGSVGELAAFTIAGAGNGRLARGQVLYYNAALSSAQSTNIATLTPRSTVNGRIYASLHIQASSGGIMTFSVRGSSAANFGTQTTMLKWTDLDGATGAGSARFGSTKIPSTKMSFYKCLCLKSSGQITGSIFVGDGVK